MWVLDSAPPQNSQICYKVQIEALQNLVQYNTSVIDTVQIKYSYCVQYGQQR